MKKEQFIKLVNALIEELEYIEKLRLLGIDLPFSKCYTAIEEYLIEELDLDEESDKSNGYYNDLSYFLYDTKYGNYWVEGMVTVNGKDIPLRNPDDLWELITLTNY